MKELSIADFYDRKVNAGEVASVLINHKHEGEYCRQRAGDSDNGKKQGFILREVVDRTSGETSFNHLTGWKNSKRGKTRR